MTALEPETGRLDRILAAAAVAHEPGGDLELLQSPLNPCYIGAGCVGQHLVNLHLELENVAGGLDADEVDRLLEIIGVECYRAAAVALEQECAALAAALDVTRHDFVPDADLADRCGATFPPGLDRAWCGRPADAHLHRTAARVRADLHGDQQ